jgi:hypothetical protein
MTSSFLKYSLHISGVQDRIQLIVSFEDRQVLNKLIICSKVLLDYDLESCTNYTIIPLDL